MKKQQKPKTLNEFRVSKKAAACKVCALPPAVMKQLAGRSRFKAPLKLVIEWLAAEWKIKITTGDWEKHHKERHRIGLLAAKK